MLAKITSGGASAVQASCRQRKGPRRLSCKCWSAREREGFSHYVHVDALRQYAERNIGEIKFRGQWLPGTHTPIIDRRLWDRVQTLLGQKVYKQH